MQFSTRTTISFFPFSKTFRSFLVQNHLLYNGAFTLVTTLFTRLHLVLRLGMSGDTTTPYALIVSTGTSSFATAVCQDKAYHTTNVTSYVAIYLKYVRV